HFERTLAAKIEAAELSPRTGQKLGAGWCGDPGPELGHGICMRDWIAKQALRQRERVAVPRWARATAATRRLAPSIGTAILETAGHRYGSKRESPEIAARGAGTARTLTRSANGSTASLSLPTRTLPPRRLVELTPV